MNKLAWSIAAVTDCGLVRSENQDRHYISPDRRVMVVADGMGGTMGGARASKLATEAVESLWKESPPPASDKSEIQQWLVDAVSRANSIVFSEGADLPERKRMGTTIVVAVQSEDGRLHIAHVGDSRAYLIREGRTIVLTQDHTIMMELLLHEKLTAEQLRNSPFRHFLTRCVGHKSKVEIDNTPVDLLHGDWIVLATDGLSAVLHEEEIGEVVEQFARPQQACDELLSRTIAGGAPDNVTIMVVQYAQCQVDLELRPEPA